MELRVELLAGNVTRVTPVGRWDIGGAAEIDLRLSAVAGSGRPIIIDLAAVSYLSSMGVRSLVMSGKATQLKGAKLVLLSPAPAIEEVLITAGIDRLIPIHHDLKDAVAAVST